MVMFHTKTTVSYMLLLAFLHLIVCLIVSTDTYPHHRLTLIRARHVLIGNLDVPIMLDFLLSQDVLTWDIWNEIRQINMAYRQTCSLLSHLQQKGSCAFDHFTNFLSSTQTNLYHTVVMIHNNITEGGLWTIWALGRTRKTFNSNFFKMSPPYNQ